MRQNLELTGENMRAVLQEAVYLVRYPLLSLQDLALGPAKAGWLSSDEINQLVQHHFGHSSLPERFITTPRVGISIAGRVRRFGGEKVSRCTFPTKPDFVGFSVPRDARVQLVAVGYYGSGMDTPYHGALTFKLFKQTEQIAPPPPTNVSQPIPPGRFWGPGRSRRHRDRGRDDEERGGRDGDGRGDHWERGGARLDQQPPSPPTRNESPKIIVKTVYEQTFRLEGMGSRTEPVIIRLQLAEPVYIEPDANYVLFAKLSAQGLTNCWFGEKSFHCADAAGTVNLRSVTFWTAKNPEGSQETNGTNVFGGQFPELYFQNCEMGGGDARATLMANAV
ncbi:uncharacterized protein LOC129598127 isoform X3 [Paramacrobiotus metropolitanus]|uniref:uncharacterized protein LOC129598127 isoform X3 n=1 Tax=Paramacrobiotus metropolitanus TaxID=2943436 RepID=UPI0024457607|nr:uncharacterized protein LOC129598127 isoform X3 [Paramacrobiotus metropolitanus]